VTSVRLVAEREVSSRLHSRAFQIMFAIMVVLVVGTPLVLAAVAGSGSKTPAIGLLRQDAALSAPIRAAAAAAGKTVEIRTVDSAGQGRSEVRSGTLEALVLPGAGSGLAVTVDKSADPTLRAALGAVARERAAAAYLSRVGGDPSALAAAESSATVTVTTLRAPQTVHTQRLVLGILAGIILYMGFLLAGPSIAQAVVEEKSSRVVELLLAAVRPVELMAGKVLGSGLVGLGQVVVVGGAGLVTATATHRLTLPLGSSLGTLGWVVVWFLAGFALYALLFAAAGAMVSRQEDLGGVQTPIMLPIIASWVIGISVLPGDPGSGWVAVLSLVPLLSPVLMPMRLALGVAPVWQAVLAVALTLLVAGLVLRLAARVYGNSVLRSGARVSWRQAVALR